MYIVAHRSSRNRIMKQGEGRLKKYESHKIGEVEIVLLNFLFRTRLSLPDDEVEFFYTPSHTGLFSLL